MQLRSLSAVLLAPVMLLVSPFVLAHAGAIHGAGLADGFMHPVNGLDHLLMVVAAGFWAGRSGDHGVPDVMYFLAFFVGGILLGYCSLLFPQLQLSTILIVLLTVAFVAASIAAPRYLAYIFFGGFAVYHGVVHMLEMPVPATAAGYMIGLFFSTGLLLILGLMLRQVVVIRKPHSATTS